MNRFKYVLLSAILLTSACAKVEPGWAGIVVNNYGTSKGVEDFPVKTGRVWFNPMTEDVYKFPTFLQNYLWTVDERQESPTDESFTVNSVEGATVNFDVAFSIGFVADSVPRIFVTYRKDADHIIRGYVRNIIRDGFSRHASRMKVTDIFGAGKQTLTDSVKIDLKQVLGQKGIFIDQLSIVGEMRVDAKVTASINAVLTAAQKAIEAENKVRQAEAESDQLVATAKGDSASAVIRAQGQAEANRLLQQSITSGLIEYEKIKKWDGILPKITGGATPIVDFRSNQ